MATVGRNDRCPCGSSLKYKKCCDPDRKDRNQPRRGVLDVATIELEKAFITPEGHCKKHFVVDTPHARVRIVGNEMYHRPLGETFHDFLVELVLLELGHKWYRNQWKPGVRFPHEVARWGRALFEFGQRVRRNPENRTPTGWSAHPNGQVHSLLTLGHDLYWLRHTHNRSQRLIKRLRTWDLYQGARYELAIASVFARSGFKLDYLNERSAKHCEFLATDPSGVSIAVEVKSRHRPGVHHQSGDFDAGRATRGDVRKLIKEAIEQSPGDRPFLVFVDVNALPSPDSHIFAKRWFQDVKSEIATILDPPTPTAPDPFTAIILTNYAFHYGLESENSPAAETAQLWSAFPQFALPMHVVALIQTAIDRYPRTPSDDRRVET